MLCSEANARRKLCDKFLPDAKFDDEEKIFMGGFLLEIQLRQKKLDELAVALIDAMPFLERVLQEPKLQKQDHKPLWALYQFCKLALKEKQETEAAKAKPQLMVIGKTPPAKVDK